MEFGEATSTSSFNNLGYSQIHRQKREYFDHTNIPNYIEIKSRRQSTNSLIIPQNNLIAESRSKTPPSRSISKQSTPNNKSRREQQQAALYPAISNQFLQVCQTDFNLEDHLEMRRRYHNSSSKQKGMQKSQSYTNIKSFTPEPVNYDYQNYIDYAKYKQNYNDFEVPLEHNAGKENISVAKGGASKSRIANEPKQIYYVINPTQVENQPRYSKPNIFELPNKTNKAHQYNFSFTEREFSEMNK